MVREKNVKWFFKSCIFYSWGKTGSEQKRRSLTGEQKQRRGGAMTRSLQERETQVYTGCTVGLWCITLAQLRKLVCLNHSFDLNTREPGAATGGKVGQRERRLIKWQHLGKLKGTVECYHGIITGQPWGGIYNTNLHIRYSSITLKLCLTGHVCVVLYVIVVNKRCGFSCNKMKPTLDCHFGQVCQVKETMYVKRHLENGCITVRELGTLEQFYRSGQLLYVKESLRAQKALLHKMCLWNSWKETSRGRQSWLFIHTGQFQIFKI